MSSDVARVEKRGFIVTIVQGIWKQQMRNSVREIHAYDAHRLNVYRMKSTGGCAAYGHSCFGGHGKRSGPAEPGTDCKDTTNTDNVRQNYYACYRPLTSIIWNYIHFSQPDCPPKLMDYPLYRKMHSLNQEIAVSRPAIVMEILD